MYGEVMVPYTGIGGQNMDSGIMPADIGGSTGPGVSGSDGGMVIYWVYPGGIQSTKVIGMSEGLWGYLVEPMGGPGSKVMYDSDVETYLQREHGIIDANDPQIVAILNELVREYAERVQRNDNGYNEEYDWGRFNRVFGNCIKWL